MFKKSVAALLVTGAMLTATAAFGAAHPAKGAVLEKDTEVLVTVLDRLRPQTVKSGDIILFSVAAPVKNKDRQVIIEQSADAWGTIVRVPKTKALSTDEPDWETRPEWARPDRQGQLEKERERREKLRKKMESRLFKKQKRGKKITSDDVYPPLEDKNWGTLGITIDRAVTVNSKDVALIADVAREDSHTMVTKDRRASFDIEQANRERIEREARKAKGEPVSDDKFVSRDITIAIPWNVFTTGTLSVVEPGTVLRARVLETVIVSEDEEPKEEIKKPVPKAKKPQPRRHKRKVRRKRPGKKCPCCFYCTCNRGSSCSCHNKNLPVHPDQKTLDALESKANPHMPAAAKPPEAPASNPAPAPAPQPTPAPEPAPQTPAPAGDAAAKS